MFKEAIAAYRPKNEQETVDQAAMLAFIDNNPDCLLRSNLVAHLTASALVVDKTCKHVLFVYHTLYDSWSWVGGHTDGDGDLLRVALKEAREETGVETITPYDEAILGLDVIHVTNHIKHGVYVPDHLHLNVTYLLVADRTAPVQVKPDENSAVRWFEIDTVCDFVSEDRMKPIYRKLFAAMRAKQGL
ncbi:MAG: NUDIX domain-containing protein [Acholeplasmatales bacterium]|nr:MAG: NUDIX domain-containing protein [Acholeplasmatales bacterium]